MSNEAFRLAQERYDNMEDPRCAEWALDDAVDARIDQILTDKRQLVSYDLFKPHAADAFARAMYALDKNKPDALQLAGEAMHAIAHQFAQDIADTVREELLDPDYVGDEA